MRYNEIDIPLMEENHNLHLLSQGEQLHLARLLIPVSFYIVKERRQDGTVSYKLAHITQRYQLGNGNPWDQTPYHTMIDHHTDNLDELLELAQLAEWFTRNEDRLALDCILEGHRFYDLRAKAYYQRQEARHSILTTLGGLYWPGATTNEALLAPMPTLEELNEIIAEGKDWRVEWVRRLPPDPLHLLRFREDAPHEIDWFATIRRVAATVAIRRNDGRHYSYASSIELLLSHQGIPYHWCFIDASFHRLVRESGSMIRFGMYLNSNGQKMLDTGSIIWETDPSPYAASVPVCSSCGHPKDLSTPCDGIFYGDVLSATEQKDRCPFDGYGCTQSEVLYMCCRCQKVWELIDKKASVEEIETFIAQLKAENV